MLKNYFKIAIRHLWKYRFYSTLNILGLGIGIAAFLFILLYVREEISYDRYHPHPERIVRIDFHGRLGENEFISANNAAPVGPALTEEYPEVEAFCRFRQRGSYLIRYEGNTYKETDIIYVDSSFFEFFGVPLYAGNPGDALTEPNSIVLTDKMADKYFGEEDPLDKILVLDNRQNYRVTGVMAEIPDNTHFQYDFLLSMSSLESSRESDWGSMNYNTYVRLRHGADQEEFEDKIQETFRRGFEPELIEYVGTTWDDFMAAGNYAYYRLMPLRDIHLYSDKDDELAANGDYRYVYIFGLIGLFILIIAGINFVNLTTANSINRAREVGVRKVIGAVKGNLIKQFLSESTIVAVVSLFIAIGILLISLSWLNDISAKHFVITDFSSPVFVFSALAVAVITGILSGSYPALYLSRFRPISVLKGNMLKGQTKSYFRNGLVIFQFFISTILIIGTVVVTKQLRYMQNKKMGYDRNQVLILNDAYALGDQIQSFKNTLKEHPAVQNASVTGFLPVFSNRNTSSYFKGKLATQENAYLIANWYVDFDYVNTMGMEIIRGRDFDINQPTDSMSIIINEELARQLAYEDPVGEYMSGFRGEEFDSLVHFKIIGVVHNFHFSSLRDRIQPLALFIGNNQGAMSFKLKSSEISSFIGDLESQWKTMAPGQPFAYQFMDERFSRMYESEMQLSTIVAVFSFLAIFIACMGLLGLATYVAQQRTKEIGIRKVLGADISNLVVLLCKDYGILVFAAFTLAAPAGWILMQQWLNDFAFSISMSLGIVLFAALLVIFMALLSVIYQAIRVSLVKPVQTLKWE